MKEFAEDDETMEKNYTELLKCPKRSLKEAQISRPTAGNVYVKETMPQEIQATI